jgi:hypothetical protein
VWLIYALGGGWGHLTRAVALASIARRDRPVRVLTNSAYASIVAASLPSLDLVMLDPCAPAESIRGEVQREIAASRPSCLIVDTFPRGIGGELAGILGAFDACKVLVHRDLNPRYVEAVGIREFVAAHYDLVLVPGAGEGSQLGDLPAAVETDAWLVRSADEIPARGEILGVDRSVLICASGNKDELDWYGAVFTAIRELDRDAPVRVIAAERPAACPEECWIRYWPAMDLFGCAAVVVGGAGYNTIRECVAWRVPLVARAWPRTYDRQELRARQAAARGRVTLVQTPQDAARFALEQIKGGLPDAPDFVNGAVDAVRRIAGANLTCVRK